MSLDVVAAPEAPDDDTLGGLDTITKIDKDKTPKSKQASGSTKGSPRLLPFLLFLSFFFLSLFHHLAS